MDAHDTQSIIDLFLTILSRMLTPERVLVAEKLLDILLAALAVQLIYNGLADLGVVAGLTHP